MEENLIYQKRIKAFSAISILSSFVFGHLFTAFSDYLSAGAYTDSSVIISAATSLGSILSTLVIFLTIGYLLTKDIRKSMIFAGAMYFGKQAISIATSLISAIFDSLSILEIIPDNIAVILGYAVDVIALPFIIFASCFAFTALEGINSKFPENGLTDSQLSLSEARKRYIVYYIIIMIVSSIITSVPTFFSAFFTSSVAASWTSVGIHLSAGLTPLVSFMFFYLAGYRAFKNHIDAIAIISCDGVSGAIASLATTVLFAVQSRLLENAISSIQNGSTGLMMVPSVLTIGLSLLTFVISLGFTLFFLKYFFSEGKITLFSEQLNEQPIMFE